MASSTIWNPEVLVVDDILRAQLVAGLEFAIIEQQNLGWTYLGPYADNIVVNASTNFISYNYLLLRPRDGVSFPFTLTGDFGVDSAYFDIIGFGGDASLRGDLANATDPVKGAALVGLIRDAANAIAVDMRKWANYQSVNFMDFLSNVQRDDYLSGTGALDLSVPYAAAITYIRGLPKKKKLVFPAGTLTYSVAPNLAIQDCEIIADGEVFLNYTGNGTAFVVDGQNTVNGNIYNLRIGKFLVTGSPTGTDAVYTASLHHSYVAVKVLGAVAAAWRNKFSVCTIFDIQATKNGQPGSLWHNGLQPVTGFIGTELNPGELTSYCTFINPVIEHCSSTCMLLDKAFGNTVIGGTLEGAGSVGLSLTANAFNNKIYDVDFEVNTDHDIYCLGRENYIINCDTDNQVTFDGAAVNNTLQGGAHNDILLTAATVNNNVQDLVYNRNAGAFTITDLSGGKNFFRNLTNRGTSAKHNALPQLATIVVGTSPFVYTNTTKNEQDVVVSGGTVSAIEFVRIPLGFINVGQTSGMFRVSPGDSLQITHAGVPNMRMITR